MDKMIMYYDGDMVELIRNYEDLNKSLVMFVSTNRRRIIYSDRLSMRRRMIKIRVNDSYVRLISKGWIIND